jgi:hypothetical protein
MLFYVLTRKLTGTAKEDTTVVFGSNHNECQLKVSAFFDQRQRLREIPDPQQFKGHVTEEKLSSIFEIFDEDGGSCNRYEYEGMLKSGIIYAKNIKQISTLKDAGLYRQSENRKLYFKFYDSEGKKNNKGLFEYYFATSPFAAMNVINTQSTKTPYYLAEIPVKHKKAINIDFKFDDFKKFTVTRKGTEGFRIFNDKQKDVTSIYQKGPSDKQVREKLVANINLVSDKSFRWLKKEAKLVGPYEAEDSRIMGDDLYNVTTDLANYLRKFMPVDKLLGERGLDALSLGIVYRGRAFLKKTSTLEGDALAKHIKKAPQYELAEDRRQ